MFADQDLASLQQAVEHHVGGDSERNTKSGETGAAACYLAIDSLGHMLQHTSLSEAS